MNNKKDKKNKKDGRPSSRVPGVGRRDLMKMVGAGAGVAAMSQMLYAPSALAQEQGPRPVPTSSSSESKMVPGGPPYLSPHTPTRRVVKYGWKNTSGRISGNGPMDETSRKIVSYVSSFKQPELTDKLVGDIGVMLLDNAGCTTAAMDTDSIRAGARLAKLSQGTELKSTVWGYGISTTPEMAAFVGSCAVRHYDNNIAGMHESDQIPAIIAIGEALHSSGPEVLSAIVLFWEVFAALLGAKYVPGAPGDRGVWSTIDNHCHAPATAMAVGKLLKLDEDRLGNALSLSFVDHMPLGVDHWEGPNSMSKSNHDAALCHAAVFAALSARAGITGPAQPFEGPKGLMDVITGRFEVTIPSRLRNDIGGYPTIPLGSSENEYVVESLSYKRYPANGGFGLSTIMPGFRKFCKVDDIESIDMETRGFGDGSDEGKLDPLNEDTADHSSQYCFARFLMDGDLFISDYTHDKLTEPAIRQLMAKITLRENPDLRGGERITIRTKSGQEMTQVSEGYKTRMTVEEVNKKFDRFCAYRGVTNEQRDRIRNDWADLRKVKDIAVLIRDTVAHYGKPLPL